MVSFDEKVYAFINEQELIQQGDRLLIACSGGIDSMGLLHLFLDLRKKLEIEIFVAHVDHMLRGKTSLEDRQFVESFCREKGVPIFSTSIPIPKILEAEGGNSQAICRRERYAYFAEVMKNYSIEKLVTAHHADDQLESMLMSLTRAGSITGMKGIYASRTFSFGTIIRPFLSVTKNEIKEFLENKSGNYREDSSNSKDDYTRNRFRHHIIPLMKNENVHVPQNAVQFAQHLQEDDDYLFSIASKKYGEVIKEVRKGKFSLKIPDYIELPVSIQRRITLLLLNYLYGDSEYANSEALIKSINQLCKSQDGSATIHLPNDFVANRKYSEVIFEKIESPSLVNEKLLEFNKWNVIQNGICLYIGDATNVENLDSLESRTVYYFHSNSFKAPFRIRLRKEGDRIHLKGMETSKRLSRLFIDEKVPLLDRDQLPILVDAEDNVMAVLGIRVNKNFSKIKRAQDDIKIIIEYNNI
ncbi:MAG TPA: tRNA lysidine(34) synthetase TilS [Ureibacillus sp.]|nr:tRNA lysidine(34) synthetase TilS [Ureibacillus sp.]